MYLWYKSRSLFNSSSCLLCLSISIYAFNNASFVAILIIRTVFCSVWARTILWSSWINLSLSNPLLFCSFSILDYNFFIFVRLLFAFVEALSMFLQAWFASSLRFLLFLQYYPHLLRHHLPFSLGNPNLVLTFTLYTFWLIISYYVLMLHLLNVSDSLHKHFHILLYVRWLSILLLICIIFHFHVFHSKN